MTLSILKYKDVKQTSIISYIEEIKKNNIGRMQQKVLEAFKENPDSTDFEITCVLGFNNPNKVRPRRKELVNKGLLLCSGTRKCIISNKNACVWRIK